MKAAWIVATVLWAAAALAAGPHYALQVDGLACPFCAYGIEKQLRRIEGVQDVQVDIKAGQVRVTLAEGRALTEARARQATEDAGFRLRGFAAESAP